MAVRILVGHFIIEEMIEAWDDKEKIKDQFKKFVKRYKGDKEFAELSEKFHKALNSADANTIDKVKVKLGELKNSRQFDSSGGTHLPFKDRRHFG